MYPQQTWHRWESPGLPYSITQTRSTTAGQALLEDFKVHARITHSSEDTRLAAWLDRSIRDLEDDLATLLIIGAVVEYYDDWPWDYLEVLHLHRAPVSSITSIKYYDPDDVLQTWSSSNYTADLINLPARVMVADGATVTSPSVDIRPNAVEITYQAGQAATVAALDPRTIDAIFTRAAWLYGPGRELMPEVDPRAVERCWQHEISRLRWCL